MTAHRAAPLRPYFESNGASALLSAWMRSSQHLAKVRVAGSSPVVRSKESLAWPGVSRV